MVVLVGVVLLGRGRWVHVVEDEPANGPTCISESTFAVIGDYGTGGRSQQDVADLVLSHRPAFIVTTGDNNYPNGAADSIDANIGKYFAAYIHPYTGSYGPGATENRFWPVPGNHDWRAQALQPYLDYFTLPGNERYYDIVRGPVHFFMLDSDEKEPDGISADSRQALWLRDRLAASNAPWQIVVLHHAPYSSGNHGSHPTLQWPFAAWGVDAVLAGHDHLYERIERDGYITFVNGAGGRRLYAFGAPVEGSMARYNREYGAMFVDSAETCLTFSFVNRHNEVIDSRTVWRD